MRQSGRSNRQSERDKRLSDRDKRKSDRDKRKSDRDKRQSDRDGRQNDRDKRQNDRDKRQSERDKATETRDKATETRDKDNRDNATEKAVKTKWQRHMEWHTISGKDKVVKTKMAETKWQIQSKATEFRQNQATETNQITTSATFNQSIH